MDEFTQAASPQLSRHERRRFDRELRRLAQDRCSICQRRLAHNSRLTVGLDAQGVAAVAGPCCADRVVTVLGLGLFHDSWHQYDFMADLAGGVFDSASSPAKVLQAIEVVQNAVARTDKRIDDAMRRSGCDPRRIGLLDTAWKDDDRAWFASHPDRAHRARLPFPGEAEEAEKVPAGHVRILLIRQIEPGYRVKASFYLNADFFPIPDDEAVVHALFEVAAKREPLPRDRYTLHALVDRYTASRA
jgi:hypothetical protein